MLREVSNSRDPEIWKGEWAAVIPKSPRVSRQYHEIGLLRDIEKSTRDLEKLSSEKRREKTSYT